MSAITQKDSLKERLGSDLKFPIAVDFYPISGIDLLLQDIQQLLLTIPGERVFRPNYGCNLRNMIWENIEVAERKGAASIKSALKLFEPRINVIDVQSSANRNTGLVTFNIRFVIINTDTQVNLVFPFRTSSQISAQ